MRKGGKGLKGKGETREIGLSERALKKGKRRSKGIQPGTDCLSIWMSMDLRGLIPGV